MLRVPIDIPYTKTRGIITSDFIDVQGYPWQFEGFGSALTKVLFT